ncbi:MAG: IclR family transcriptional regulator [Pseudomonadota bacterium]
MADTARSDGTVGKALDVLDQIAGFGRPVRFAELQDHSPFPKATLYRLVQTLTNQGMLFYDPDRQTYAMGVRLVRLAHAAWQQSSLAPIARPHIERLSHLVGETVHLAQLDHAQVLYVDKLNAANPLPLYSEAGKVGPAYCTGVGKAMLAFLDADNRSTVIDQQSFHKFTQNTLPDATTLQAELAVIKQAGHGFDREEHEPGIICVAVPILSAQSRVLGALSVTSSRQRTTLDHLAHMAPQLKQTARAIADDMAAWRFPDNSPKGTNPQKDQICLA